jgi:hypothetical protein
VNQLLRVQIEPHTGLRAAPRSLHRGKRRIETIVIIDQWYGPGYRYVKVRGHDRSVCILRFDEIGDQWELIVFSSARAQGLASARRAARRACVARLIPFHFSARYRERADELTREAETTSAAAE